jgi:hypothetical protein
MKLKEAGINEIEGRCELMKLNEIEGRCEF